MRDRHSSEQVAKAIPPVGTTFTERHYTPAEIAAMWAVSYDTVLRIFKQEPGVLVLGEANGGGKRRYSTLRIPESVLQRAYRQRLLVRA